MNAVVDVYVCPSQTPDAGIQRYTLSLATGDLIPGDLIAGPPNVGFLAIDPTGRYLYALHGLREVDGAPGGGVSAWSINPSSGNLNALNLQPVHGLWPSYIAIDPVGRWLIAVTYGTGNVVAFPIRADGSLDPPADIVQHHGSSVNPDRQEGPHAHSVVMDPTGELALVADLGLDQIVIYRLDMAQPGLKLRATGSIACRPGSGPRHLAYHPNRRFLYSTDELTSTVTAFAGDARAGTLRPIQAVSTVPAGFAGPNSLAHLQFASSGNFLYASNRGHDSIAVFAADAASGQLEPRFYAPSGGQSPRHFSIDPTGGYLLVANEKTSSLVAFRLDPVTGALSQTALIDTPHPVFVLCR